MQHRYRQEILAPEIADEKTPRVTIPLPHEFGRGDARLERGEMSAEQSARAWIALMRFADSVGIAVGIVGEPSIVNRTMATGEVQR